MKAIVINSDLMLPDSTADFAAWVAKHRTALGLNRSQLAERCGMAPNEISRIEQGKRPDPRLSTVLDIGKAIAACYRLKAASSLDRYLNSDVARDRKITSDEIKMLRAAWPLGQDEPGVGAWDDVLRAVRAMNENSQKKNNP